MRQLRLAPSLFALCAAIACAAPALADEPKAHIEGVEDDALGDTLKKVIGESKRPAQSRYEARQRAESAAEDAITVLRSEGYYDYQVIPDVTVENGVRRPVLRISTGKRFTVVAPAIEWANTEPGAEAKAAASAALSLPEGAPGRAAEVVAAEARVLAVLQDQGYADAAALPRRVTVDHATATLQPVFRIDARDLTRMDGLKIRTRGRTNPDWVVSLAPWKEGETYEPKDVAELERRLQETGVYRSVNVSLDKGPDAQGLRPVVVGLSDRPKATIEGTASYSTYEGIGGSLRYTMFNRLNRADTITFGAQYSDILRRIDAQLSLPHWRKPNDTLRLTAQIFQDDTEAYRTEDAGLRAELIHRFGKTSFRTYGLAIDATDNDEPRLENGALIINERKLFLATGIAALTLDRTDDPLNPTRGWKFDGRVEPTAFTGDDTGLFLKGVAQGSTYYALGETKDTVLAARIRLGSVLGGDIPVTPSARRFFAGGGGSVRGFGYQEVGPRFPDGTPIGGLSLLEGTFEVRHRFTDRWGGVVFLDAGTVGQDQYPTFKDVSYGAGVGVRYDLGFGPIRADIAVPLNRREGDAAFQLYLSIGQSF